MYSLARAWYSSGSNSVGEETLRSSSAPEGGVGTSVCGIIPAIMREEVEKHDVCLAMSEAGTGLMLRMGSWRVLEMDLAAMVDARRSARVAVGADIVDLSSHSSSMLYNDGCLCCY